MTQMTFKEFTDLVNESLDAAGGRDDKWFTRLEAAAKERGLTLKQGTPPESTMVCAVGANAYLTPTTDNKLSIGNQDPEPEEGTHGL